MRDVTWDLRPFSGDPEMVLRVAALRDLKIREELKALGKDTLAYRAGKWLAASVGGSPAAARWCRQNGLEITRAQATLPNSAGGFLIPEELAATVVLLLEKYGVTRAQATIWPMTSDSEVVPRATGGFTTSWINENSGGASARASFDGVQLSAKKLGAFVKVSTELMDDAGEKLGTFFVRGLVQGFAKAEDVALFGGDGTSAYGGVVGVGTALTDGNHAAGKITAATGHDSFATIDATDIGNLIAALPSRAMTNGKIYVSITGYGAALTRLAGTAGGLVATVGEDGELHANWHGLPVVLTSALPTSTGTLASGTLMMAAGDMRQAAAFGVRRDMAAQSFAERYADVGQVLIRATERVDIVPHDLGDNAAAGALVGLFAP